MLAAGRSKIVSLLERLDYLIKSAVLRFHFLIFVDYFSVVVGFGFFPVARPVTNYGAEPAENEQRGYKHKPYYTEL